MLHLLCLLARTGLCCFPCFLPQGVSRNEPWRNSSTTCTLSTTHPFVLYKRIFPFEVLFRLDASLSFYGRRRQLPRPGVPAPSSGGVLPAATDMSLVRQRFYGSESRLRGRHQDGRRVVDRTARCPLPRAMLLLARLVFVSVLLSTGSVAEALLVFFRALTRMSAVCSDCCRTKGLEAGAQQDSVMLSVSDTLERSPSLSTPLRPSCLRSVTVTLLISVGSMNLNKRL